MLSVLRSWRQDGIGPASLARALRAQLELRQALENRGPRCELVWTGEVGVAAGIRSTLPVVREMLQWATRSVVVVTYSMWIGEEQTGAVITRLAELSSAGVDVTFILDRRYRDSWNITQLKVAWPAQRRRPTVYSWQDEKDEIAKLHAKVFIVDRRDLLITSANLTGRGMRRNLEFGLRVVGRPAKEAADHLDALIRDGVFQLVPWI
jgi:phosphatidylserine/phosphatidylglycerophosphate/cardiolipin synthase-like enzyme